MATGPCGGVAAASSQDAPAHAATGHVWTKHSLRSAGATAALSVGVDVFTIARLGGWASIESVKLYVDPFVVPHLYSFLVFGPWLRKSLDAVLAAHRQVRSS
ncbi:MAG: hypothetical protein RIS62_282 [Chloroflexota bacterium]